jgi:predicted nuclease of predicted toxin-antitoxin system
LRFLVDAQLPPALARRLAALGHRAEHVADCGLAQASDDAIRGYATSVSAVIVTKDEDFAVHRVLHGGPSVVWIRIGNTRRAELLRRIEADFEKLIRALDAGETLVEIADLPST